MKLPVAQYSFDFSTGGPPSLENFVVGPNGEAVAMLRELVSGQGERRYLCIAGAPGTGKTHLLIAAARAGQGFYLDLDQPDLDIRALENLDTVRLVCLDGIGVVAGRPDWEHALFRLFNELESSGTSLVVADCVAPNRIGFALPDLVSRLASGPLLGLAPLQEDELEEALITHAGARGFELDPRVAAWMVHRERRDIAHLLALLADLDRASFAARRPLTVPFARAFVELMRDGPQSADADEADESAVEASEADEAIGRIEAPPPPPPVQTDEAGQVSEEVEMTSPPQPAQMDETGEAAPPPPPPERPERVAAAQESAKRPPSPPRKREPVAAKQEVTSPRRLPANQRPPGPAYVRPWEPLDRDGVDALWREVPDLAPAPEGPEQADPQLALMQDGGFFFVALDGDEIVGTVAAAHDGRQGRLDRLVVSSPHRRRGIGTALVRRALRALRGAGCREVEFQVPADDPAVRAFSASFGFAAEEEESPSENEPGVRSEPGA